MNITNNSIPKLPVGMHRYERGLYIRVTDKSRYWVLKYQIAGVRREMGLGNAMEQGITAVTAKADAARALIASGIDPIQHKKEQAQALREKMEESKRNVTVRSYVPGAVKRILVIRRYSSVKAEKEWYNLSEEIVSLFGNYQIKELTPKLIADKLLPIITVRPRRAQDIVSKLSGIIQCAIADGITDKNPSQWASLKTFLPSVEQIRREIPIKHHVAIPAAELKVVCEKLYQAGTVGSLCALFGILSAGRLSEFSHARWEEIDWDNKVLRVPQERRKDKKAEPFAVPLTRQMLAILEKVKGLCPTYLFPGIIEGQPLSRGGVVKNLRKCTDKKDLTMHGSRSTFSDWCMQNEKNFIVSEKCLMHAVGNTVFRAYQRDDLLDQRRVLMQEWADYLLPEL